MGDITPAGLMGTLNERPRGLEKLYEDIVGRLKIREPNEDEKSKRWLKCGTFAGRPLSGTEFREAVTILKFEKWADISSSSFLQSQFPIAEDLSMLKRALSNTCGGLLEVRSHHITSPTGSLVHRYPRNRKTSDKCKSSTLARQCQTVSDQRHSLALQCHKAARTPADVWYLHSVS